MKRKLLVGVGVLVLSAASAVGFAATRSGHGPERAERFINYRVDSALDDLGATDDQRRKILAIKDSALADGRETFKDHREVRDQLQAEWNKEKPDAARVHALIDARADAMRAMAHKMADNALAVHDVLTPDQRAQVSQEIAEHSHHH